VPRSRPRPIVNWSKTLAVSADPERIPQSLLPIAFQWPKIPSAGERIFMEWRARPGKNRPHVAARTALSIRGPECSRRPTDVTMRVFSQAWPLAAVQKAPVLRTGGSDMCAGRRANPRSQPCCARKDFSSKGPRRRTCRPLPLVGIVQPKTRPRRQTTQRRDAHRDSSRETKGQRTANAEERTAIRQVRRRLVGRGEAELALLARSGSRWSSHFGVHR
jgi:hypothetical protein